MEYRTDAQVLDMRFVRLIVCQDGLSYCIVKLSYLLTSQSI